MGGQFSRIPSEPSRQQHHPRSGLSFAEQLSVGCYANWNALEPNNLGGSEDHLTIGRYGDDTWNDEGYWLPNMHGFVVEFEGAAVPEPSPFSCLAIVGLGFFAIRKWRQRKWRFKGIPLARSVIRRLGTFARPLIARARVRHATVTARNSNLAVSQPT